MDKIIEAEVKLAEQFDSIDDAMQAAIDLQSRRTGDLWALGDCVNAARSTFGPSAERHMAGATKLTTRWLHQLACVAATWPADQRRLDIGWDVYSVASATDDPHGWLNEALRNEWSAADLRRAIVKARGGTSLDSKQSAARFCRNFERLLPHLRKLLEKPRMRPYQEEWYELGQNNIASALCDALTVARAFEASKK